MKFVRRANLADARGIHEAHMRSIQEVCSRDHSPEEIKVWGNGPYNEEHRRNAIENNFVWVVEADGQIAGYGLLQAKGTEPDRYGYIAGLYLTPEAQGYCFGKEIVSLMLLEAQALGLKRVALDSTITAHGFYKKRGFQDTGPQKLTEISGVGVHSFPMELML